MTAAKMFDISDDGETTRLIVHDKSITDVFEK